MRVPEPSSKPRSHAFLVSLVVSALVLLVLIGALNVVVDPLGDHATGLLPPLIVTSRRAKVALARESSPKPEALIIGSSRAMKVEPSYVHRRFGLTAFNASTNSARTEDYLATVRYLSKELGWQPRLIILGLDVEAFHNQARVDLRLTQTPELRRQLPELEDPSSRFDWGFWSWQSTMASLRSLWFAARGRPEPTSSFQADGFLVYNRYERQLREGVFRSKPLVAKSKREYLRRYEGYTGLAVRRLQYFDEFVAFCRKHSIDLRVFITTLHPDVVEVLEGRTEFAKLRARVVELLSRYQRNNDLHFVDATEPRAFGGDEELFYDGGHTREPNIRKIVDRLFAMAPEPQGRPHALQ